MGAALRLGALAASRRRCGVAGFADSLRFSMPRIVGDWTLDKLKIIEQYLPAYLTATYKASERVYIDAFAGPGRNEIKGSGNIVNGSPLIALNARSAAGKVFDRLYFIELDKTDADELETSLVGRDPHRRAEVIRGDVNTELPRLLGRSSPRSPTFVFLDPEGIDPGWDTIQALAASPTALLINFPLGMAINRNPDSAKVTKYFGTEAWRPLWEAGSLRASRLLALYKERLSDLGYVHQVEDSRLVKTEGNRRLYYLIFVSKVPVAQRIMKSVFKQPDAAGQPRMNLFPEG